MFAAITRVEAKLDKLGGMIDRAVDALPGPYRLRIRRKD
jgi:hypothetical protein